MQRAPQQRPSGGAGIREGAAPCSLPPMAGQLFGQILVEAKADIVRYRAAALPAMQSALSGVRARAAAASQQPTALLAAPTAPVPALAHPWGVQWPGKADVRTCAVDFKAIAGAFKMWQGFTIVPDDEMSRELAVVMEGASAAPEVPDSQLTEEGLLHRRIFAAMRR
uniref:Uncharacterized protein n=1 Tax=Zooxanthella nutricula TaxID=1333877 RepID=A0A7S2H7K9_9DINO